MAKVGEGDLRWIVHEREDGTNVNNWHWTEKNCLPWIKERLEQSFKNLQIIDTKQCQISITSVNHVKGEASINQRKGKMFHIYELDVELKLAGTYVSDVNNNNDPDKSEKFEGTITFSEVSFENDDNDQDFEYSITKAPKYKSAVIEILKRQGGFKKCQAVLGDVLKEFKALKGDYKEVKEAVPLTAAADLIGKGVALELVEGSGTAGSNGTDQATGGGGGGGSATAASSSSSQSSSSSSTTKATGSSGSGAGGGNKKQVTTKTLNDEFKFRARSADVYESLLDQRRVEAFTQSSAKIDKTVGSPFELYGGNISGKILELVPNEKIVQQWRTSSWPEGHYSKVTMQFKDTNEGCVLNLIQEGIPQDEMANIKQAWNTNVFERMKRLFGFGFSYSPF